MFNVTSCTHADLKCAWPLQLDAGLCRREHSQHNICSIRRFNKRIVNDISAMLSLTIIAFVKSTSALDSSSKYSLGSDMTLGFGQLGRWCVSSHKFFKIFFHNVRTLYWVSSRSRSIPSFSLYSWRQLSLSSSVWHHLAYPKSSCFFLKNMSMYAWNNRFVLSWKFHTLWTLTSLYPIFMATCGQGPLPDWPTSRWRCVACPRRRHRANTGW